MPVAADDLVFQQLFNFGKGYRLCCLSRRLAVRLRCIEYSGVEQNLVENVAEFFFQLCKTLRVPVLTVLLDRFEQFVGFLQ